MKIELDKDEQQRILDKVIEELHTNKEARYSTASYNPIEREFRIVVNQELKNIMPQILDDDKFKERIYELGMELVKQYLEFDLKDLVNKLLKREMRFNFD